MSLAALALAAALASGPPAAGGRALSDYRLHCAGCHGLDGRSASRVVPDLKDRAGFFLCDAGGRDYMGRLPNLVFSGLSDAGMAGVLNYVVFGLGGAQAHARAYDAAEMARLRQAPLSSTDLKRDRRAVVDRLVARCGAPEALRTDYGAALTPPPGGAASPRPGGG